MNAAPLASLTLGGYLEALAAKQPVPGGGAASAVALAHGAALGSMVLHYTLGKPKFASWEHDNAAMLLHLDHARTEALALADLDAQAYAALNALWRLPKDDPGRAGFASAVLAAIAAPEATVVLAHDTVGELAKLCGTTSPSLASDLRIALDLAAAAALAAQENVRINLPSVEDPSLRGAISARTEAVLAAATARAGALRASLG